MCRVNFRIRNILYSYSRKPRENLCYIFQLKETAKNRFVAIKRNCMHLCSIVAFNDFNEILLNMLLSSSSICHSPSCNVHRIDSSHITIVTPRSSRRSSRSYPFAEGERQRESHASRRMGEGRSAWAARCVARASDLLASACMRFDTEGEHILGRLNMSAISIQTRLVTSRL